MLSSYEKPWTDIKRWESIDGEFKISAACSRLGKVTFELELSHYGFSEEWAVKTQLNSETGQLPRIAKSAQASLVQRPANSRWYGTARTMPPHLNTVNRLKNRLSFEEVATMMSWINFVVLVASSVLFTIFYIKSVGPAALERKIGQSAYKKCATYRLVASFFMLVVAINYVLYFWFPLPLSIPVTFPWPWFISALIAVCIGLPSGYIMLRGVKDAGEETMEPKREHEMYGGIYELIRHPQAVGEFPLWWSIAFLVHSPFLVMFSFVYIPIWYCFCVAEEKDLLIRYGSPYKEYCKSVGFWIPKNM